MPNAHDILIGLSRRCSYKPSFHGGLLVVYGDPHSTSLTHLVFFSSSPFYHTYSSSIRLDEICQETALQPLDGRHFPVYLP